MPSEKDKIRCPTCGRPYGSGKSFSEHICIDEAVERFFCLRGGCEYIAKHEGSMRRHVIKVHYVVKPVKAPTREAAKKATTIPDFEESEASTLIRRAKAKLAKTLRKGADAGPQTIFKWLESKTLQHDEANMPRNEGEFDDPGNGSVPSEGMSDQTRQAAVFQGDDQDSSMQIHELSRLSGGTEPPLTPQPIEPSVYDPPLYPDHCYEQETWIAPIFCGQAVCSGHYSYLDAYMAASVAPMFSGLAVCPGPYSDQETCMFHGVDNNDAQGLDLTVYTATDPRESMADFASRYHGITDQGLAYTNSQTSSNSHMRSFPEMGPQDHAEMIANARLSS